MCCKHSPLHQEVDQTPLWTGNLKSKRRTELVWAPLGTRRSILKEGFQGSCEMSPFEIQSLIQQKLLMINANK